MGIIQNVSLATLHDLHLRLMLPQTIRSGWVEKSQVPSDMIKNEVVLSI